MNRPTARTFSLSLLCIPLLCLSGTLMTGCAGWQPPEVVQVEGADMWQCLSPLYGLTFAAAEEEGPAYMLVRHDELILPADFEGDYLPWFPYRSTDRQPLKVASDEGRGTLAGTTIALLLDEDEAWEWLERAIPEEIVSLRLVAINNMEPPERMELVEKLASHNPHVGLILADEEIFLRCLPLFDPQFLSIADFTLGEEHQALLAGEKRLRTLAIEGGGETNLAYLKELPNLQMLFIDDWDPEDTGPLPDGLTRLRSVIVHSGFHAMKDLSPLGRQPRLEELNLMVAGLTDISALAHYPHLKVVCLRECEDVTNLSVLKQLKDLKWLALPPATTQQQFTEIIDDHPGLIVLEAMGCEQITDLAPVNNLAHLEALIVSTEAPPDPLYQMKNLKYLAVFVDEEEGEVTPAGRQLLTRLQEELPETAIVRVAPLCLGSGLILLLVPAFALAWWLSRRRRSHTGPVPLGG